MKLAFFDDFKLGVVLERQIIEVGGELAAGLHELAPAKRGLTLAGAWQEFAGDLAAAAAGEGTPRHLESVRLRAPMLRPGKILSVAGNVRHPADPLQMPVVMGLKSPSSVVDPNSSVHLPTRRSTTFYPQAELAVVIGRDTRRVDVSAALSHVLGYTCAINVVARGPGLVSGIACDSFDTFCPLGPWLVTGDEIPDPQTLAVSSSQDGQPRQRYSTASLQHSVAELISWASRRATLEPGDILLCGTDYDGLGPMQHGETVSVEIERIGSLSATVCDSLGRRWIKQPDEKLAAAMRALRQTGRPLNLHEDLAREIPNTSAAGP